ncbi:MAG: sigma-70 family RNA polymerase sigma factor [Pseudomonadota bacterium]
MLYEQTIDELVAYLRRQFGEGPPEPQEVAHAAFERLLARQNKTPIENYRAFLWTTARNLVLNTFRREKVRRENQFSVEQHFFPESGDEKAPHRVIDIRQQLALISEALERMPDERRTAFVLCRIDGLTSAEVARRCGVSRTIVHKRLAKASAEVALALDRGLPGHK